LKVGSYALARVRFKTRMCRLVIPICLGTHWAPSWYTAPSKVGCKPAS
jgi:hypothetical protein